MLLPQDYREKLDKMSFVNTETKESTTKWEVLKHVLNRKQETWLAAYTLSGVVKVVVNVQKKRGEDVKFLVCKVCEEPLQILLHLSSTGVLEKYSELRRAFRGVMVLPL